jgi:hypothetical protein
MPPNPSTLLARLDSIAASLARNEHGLALIGLGSVGAEMDRLDAYSDLDFFAIVEHGHKDAFIQDLTWLQAVAPIAFSCQNTRDGCKALFEDGIYVEFAVFDLEDLAAIPVLDVRIVWQRDGTILPDIAPPQSTLTEPPTQEWLLGEILSNLYVGLNRLQRGERLSAQRLIQGHAIDRLLDLLPLIETPAATSTDPFDRSRRIEQRFPQIAPRLSDCIQGYNRNPQSALAILEFLKQHVPLDPAIERRIRERAGAILAAE